MGWDEIQSDPSLHSKCESLVLQYSRELAKARMIAFGEEAGSFVVTDLGRIAAKYYIRHASIEIFNKELKEKMTEADILATLCMSTEVCGSSP